MGKASQFWATSLSAICALGAEPMPFARRKRISCASATMVYGSSGGFSQREAAGVGSNGFRAVRGQNAAASCFLIYP
jgi:hypothetical protein